MTITNERSHEFLMFGFWNHKRIVPIVFWMSTESLIKSESPIHGDQKSLVKVKRGWRILLNDHNAYSASVR